LDLSKFCLLCTNRKLNSTALLIPFYFSPLGGLLESCPILKPNSETIMITIIIAKPLKKSSIIAPFGLINFSSRPVYLAVMKPTALLRGRTSPARITLAEGGIKAVYLKHLDPLPRQ